MFNKEYNYIRRTAGPKYSNYVSDGYGRDRYIIFDNGGLINSNPIRSSDGLPRKYYDILYHKRAESLEVNEKINWKVSASENEKNNHLKVFNNKKLLFKESKSKSLLSSNLEDEKKNKLFYVTKKELMAMKNTRKIESQLTQRLYYSQIPKFKKEISAISKLSSNRYPFDKPILINNLSNQSKHSRTDVFSGKSVGKY